MKGPFFNERGTVKSSFPQRLFLAPTADDQAVSALIFTGLV